MTWYKKQDLNGIKLSGKSMNINRFAGSDHVEPQKLPGLNNLIHLMSYQKAALHMYHMFIFYESVIVVR